MALADRAMYAVKAERRTASGDSMLRHRRPTCRPATCRRRTCQPLERNPHFLRQDDQVVAVDDLLGTLGRQFGGLPACPLGQRLGAVAHEALGEDLAVGAGDLDGVVRAEIAPAPPGLRPATGRRPLP